MVNYKWYNGKVPKEIEKWEGLMNKRKVVTLCGSIKFWNKMQEINEKLALENEYIVIGLTPRVTNRNFTEHNKELLGELHRAKIDLSDAIFVVNVDGYIGESTRG